MLMRGQVQASIQFLKLLITDCDKFNGVTVFPGTHLHGLYPVKIEQLTIKRSV